MLTLNFKSQKFAIGKTVIVIQDYKIGSIFISKGETGIITGAKKHNYPDLGLFDILVVDFKFALCDLSMGEKVAEQYIKVL